MFGSVLLAKYAAVIISKRSIFIYKGKLHLQLQTNYICIGTGWGCSRLRISPLCYSFEDQRQKL